MPFQTLNAPPSLERIQRTWRVTETGETGAITVRIDASSIPAGGCRLFILTDADGNFTAGATQTELVRQGASSIYQATVNLSSGDHLTIGRAAGTPLNLTAMATGAAGQVTLNWNNPGLSNFTRYRIYGGTTPNPTTLLNDAITDQNTLTATLNGLTSCQLNYFRLVPVTNGNVESFCEGQASAIPTNGITPAAIANVTATVLFPENGQVQLNFDASGDTDFSALNVYIYPNGGTVPATPSSTFTGGVDNTTTQVIVPVFVPGNTCFLVTQTNGCGVESPVSNEVCVTTNRPAEQCNNGIDDDGDGDFDCSDGDCAGIDPCPGCVFQVTDPGVFKLVEYKEIDNLVGSDIGYQTPIFGNIDGDDQTEIIVMADCATGASQSICGSNSAIFYVLNPRVDGNPDIEFQQGGLLRPAQNNSLLAMGDVDGNGLTDFFYSLQDNDGAIVRYEYDYNIPALVLKWNTATVAANTTAAQRGTFTRRANVNLADFNQDGTPEVYCGGTIFDAITGEWRGYVGAGNPNGNPRILNAGTPDPIFHVSNAVDVLADGDCADCQGLELLAGNRVYSVNIATKTITTVRTSPIPASEIPDAVMSVADMDNDGDVDAVVSGFGKVYVWDMQKTDPVETLLAPVFNLMTGLTVGGNEPFSGVPTINNFDVSDPDLEFAVTKNFGVALFDFNNITVDVPEPLTVRWQVGTSDDSGTTGLSSYQFLGDGAAYLVYRDENKVRIFRGVDGNVYFNSQTEGFPDCDSGTGMELPTIGDVNNDGQTEIVASCDGRVIIYQSKNTPWLPSRPVWNQVGYNITNVNENLTIPADVNPE